MGLRKVALARIGPSGLAVYIAEIELLKPGNACLFHTHYHIGVEGKTEDYARGEATIVWMNYPKQEPTPIPPSLRTRLEEAAAAK